MESLCVRKVNISVRFRCVNRFTHCALHLQLSAHRGKWDIRPSSDRRWTEHIEIKTLPPAWQMPSLHLRWQ